MSNGQMGSYFSGPILLRFLLPTAYTHISLSRELPWAAAGMINLMYLYVCIASHHRLIHAQLVAAGLPA